MTARSQTCQAGLNVIERLAERVRQIVVSRLFFRLVVVYFVINSIWLALTALYPMAFDEDFHFRTIQIYTHHWLPYLSSQPDNAVGLGGIFRDPSYFYHYLMSFPLRLIQLFTHDQTIQVICLRFIDIALLASAFFIYRRLLLRAGASVFATHVSLALLAMVPIVPLLAAHVNYDNLLIPIVGLSLLLTVRLVQSWAKKTWDIPALLGLAALLLFGSIVKYAMLPVAFAIVIILCWKLYRGLTSRRLRWSVAKRELTSLPRRQLVLLVMAVVLGLGFFVIRDGVNLMHYGTPLPKCEQAVSFDECNHYGPWKRDYAFHQQLAADFKPNLPHYVSEWFKGMWQRSLFSISSPINGYENYPPLPVIGWMIWILFAVGSLFVLVFARQVFRGQPAFQVFLFVTLIYCVVLFADTFKGYAYTGQPVAINGRYLLPFLPLIFVVYGRAFGIAFRKLRQPAAVSLASLVVLAIMLMQGGGSTSWIVHSSPSWDWPNQTVRSVNTAVHNATRPFIIGL